MPDQRSLLGGEFELEIGPVAHGGHCVARIQDGPAAGRVVFVRHALLGERAVVRITSDAGGSFCRGDAVVVLAASTDRVEPPCPYSGPGRCGACDWQHVSAEGQRALKTEVVREQLRRLAAIESGVVVEALPGGLLGWRTRTIYAAAGDGRLGLQRHRSHEVEIVDECVIGAAGVGDQASLSRSAGRADRIELALGDDGTRSALAHRRSQAPRRGRGRRPPDDVRIVEGPATLWHSVAGRDFTVAAGGFWQVHPMAAATFAAAVLDGTDPQPDEAVLDLYAGAGLFTALLAERVGPGGQVVGIESSRLAVADAAGNLADLEWASVREGCVTPELVAGLDLRPSVVVLDPPRAGAGADVMRAIIGLEPRVIAYVSCDPASLGRDLAAAQGEGWVLARLRAFDAFPMTHHVECVAVLVAGRP